MAKFITVWRNPDSVLAWDFYISEDEREAGNVVRNLNDRKVKRASTYELGELNKQLCIGGPS